MYKKILVALENSDSDKTILPHVTELAKQLGSELLLVHVADGFAARNFSVLKLTQSEEMLADKKYLDDIAAQLSALGLKVNIRLALGDPPKELLKTAESEKCDLIAMTGHGHRLLGDLIFGSTIHEVRHQTALPVLIVRAEKNSNG